MSELFKSVGKDVWIEPDFHCEFGKNIVIEAGSIVTKDIPDNVIAVGNPCRVLRAITDADKTGYLQSR